MKIGRKSFCAALGLLLTAVTAAVSLCIPAAEKTDSAATPLPIIMYHSILRDPARSGKYIISPQTLENDMIYLKKRGYCSLTAAELAELVTKGEKLPEKPIILTFDDGYLNNLTYLLPLLERYDMKAVVSVVGSYCECFSQNKDPNPAYAYLSWEEIERLTSSGRVEIGNHSYDMHSRTDRKGIKRLRGEGEAEYYAALVCDIGRTQSLLEEYCGIVPTTFAYPFGQTEKSALPILKEMGFTVLLTCTEKINELNGDSSVLFDLGRFNRPSGISTEKFMRKIGIE